MLQVCFREGVTLVDLEQAAKSFLTRNEEVASQRKARHIKTAQHHRAINANRARWRKAQLFLEGYKDTDAKVKERIESVGSIASSLEGTPLPQPEAPLIPSKDWLMS